MKLFIKFINEFKFLVVELGIFPAVLICIVMTPVFIVNLFFLPFDVFNDWSKSWFKVK